uniref:Uncharacterized protein n=1 Tax=Panagrolaimus superbus TaxID=310955 RepID=A0A914YLR8_9BILA
MASANLKTVAVRFTRSLLLNTGKKINHLDSDSDDSDNNENYHYENLMEVAKKTLTSSNSLTLLKSLTSENDLNGDITKHSTILDEFEEKPIFQIDDDFELPSSSHEHGTVLFR